MPIYPAKCDTCNKTVEEVRPISRCDDHPICCNKQMHRVFTPLYVIEDTKPYRSPIDGKVISTKSAHRNHLKEHNVIEVGNERVKKKDPNAWIDSKENKQAIVNDLKRQFGQTV